MPKQTMPVRARSSLKLVCFFLVCAVTVTLAWGWHPGGKILSALAVFFGLVTLMELKAEKKRTATVAKAVRKTPKTLNQPMIEGYQVLEDEGTIWREKGISIGGRNVALKLPEDEKAFQAILPHAESVVRQAEIVATNWTKFKESCLRDPQFVEQQEEVRSLELEAFEFFSAKRPNVAEVILRQPKSDALWTCLFEANAFRDLSIE